MGPRRDRPNPFDKEKHEEHERKAKELFEHFNKFKTCDKCDGVGKRQYLWLFSINCNKCRGDGRVRNDSMKNHV
jgi:DnaJ-class molecular chaperone